MDLRGKKPGLLNSLNIVEEQTMEIPFVKVIFRERVESTVSLEMFSDSEILEMTILHRRIYDFMNQNGANIKNGDPCYPVRTVCYYMCGSVDFVNDALSQIV